jgi:hypothetical protein
METGMTTDRIGISALSVSIDNRAANVEKEAPTGIARISDAFSRPTL